jgi:UDP-N-acetyl-2-amino-2-deoxyglucuronate dehydrogenase
MDRLRIGLVGAGLIGAAHSLALRHIGQEWPKQVELHAVADPLAQARARFVELYGYRRAFARAEDLIAQADVNVLFVCAPTRFHAEIVKAAAAAGLHVFCEKPLAMSAEEAAEMLAAVRQAGVKSQIGLVLRFSSIYNVMRDLLRDPENGAPMAVIFRDDQCFPVRGLHDSAWRKDRTMTAGGTLIEHGVHDLDLLTWMFGPVRRLRAWQQNRAGHPGVEDYVAVEIELASGLRVQLVNIWHDMVQRSSNRRLEIFCARGYLASEHDMSGEIMVQRGDGALQTMTPAEVLQRFETLLAREDSTFRDLYSMPYFLQDLCFVEALLAGRDPAPSLEVGVRAQELAEAVYTAARTGAEVEVTETGRRDV